jgi:NAD(P)-dependent dehydrogenase (short-subunit alcohol dehydrogenase family)
LIFNKIAPITGVARSIGKAAVKAMVAARTRVVLHNGSNRKTAEKTADQAGSIGYHLVEAC